MFDHDAWRARQPSQFPSWLASDLGLDQATLDAIVARPSMWSRIRGFVASRRGGSDAIAAPQPLPVERSDPRAERDAA